MVVYGLQYIPLSLFTIFIVFAIKNGRLIDKKISNFA